MPERCLTEVPPLMHPTHALATSGYGRNIRCELNKGWAGTSVPLASHINNPNAS